MGDGHAATLPTRRSPRQLRQGFSLTQPFGQRFAQRLPGRTEPHAAAAALDQLHTALRLQRLESFGYLGLAPTQAFGGSPEVQLLGQDQEQPGGLRIY